MKPHLKDQWHGRARHPLPAPKSVVSALVLSLNHVYPGNLTSPGFPEDYPNKLYTSDVIAVNSDQLILITFTHINIEEGSQCRYDYLEITDGNGDVLLGRTCGQILPSEISSASNEVHITFRTDNGGVRSGWKLNWHSIASAAGCPPAVSKPSPGQPCSAPGLQCSYDEESCCDGESMECGPSTILSVTLSCETTFEGSVAWQRKAPTQCGKFLNPFHSDIFSRSSHVSWFSARLPL